jgi:hypothetical protein
MELKAAKAGLQMSPTVLKEELTDLREITMIYDDKTAQRLISRRSSALWYFPGYRNNVLSIGYVNLQQT